MYDEGDGVAKDARKAVEWYRKSAIQGNGLAQNNLALNYYYGKGVKRDLKEAYAWFSVAVENGDGDEAMLKRTARALNAAQLAEAKSLAASYIAKYIDE